MPDILPSSVLDAGMLSMTAGDFLEIYKDESGMFHFGQVRVLGSSRTQACGMLSSPVSSSTQRTISSNIWKTSPDFLNLEGRSCRFRLTQQLSRLDSVWINLGPSLWHFEGNTSGSIDLPLEEVKALARRLGFRLEVRLSSLVPASADIVLAE